MQASNSNVKTLIEGAKVFTVPLYQRRYSWRRENWKELWQDILEQYDFNLDESAQTAVAHFIGSFVLAPALGAGEYSKLVVVDGQQRLTTIMILLAALRDELASRETSSDGRRKIESKYNQLYLQNEHAEIANESLRLLPTQQDREEFRACVGETPAQPIGVMGEAYDFFRSDQALTGPDLQGEALDLRVVSEVINQRLTLVEIVTQNGDSVHQIFQTLNHAGVKLKQVDLLRNHFFMLLPTRGEELYAKVWRPMELRLGETALDRFFWANLVRRDARVTRNDVYAAMQRRLDKVAKTEDGVASVLLEYSSDLDAYAAITASATGDEAIDERLRFLNAWGTDTAQPVMLELVVRWRNGHITAHEVEKALTYVESFVVRRLICGIPTNNLNRLFTSMASVMSERDFGPASLRAFLAGEKKYWPSDREVQANVASRSFESGGRAWQRILLLERVLFDEVIDDRNLEIVRIAPEGLNADWLRVFGDDGEGPTALYRQVAGTLGNLTLVEARGSDDLSPDWPERRNQLSTLEKIDSPELTGSFDWTAAEVRKRSSAIASRIIDIWPGPDGATSTQPEARATSVESVLRSLPAGTAVTVGDLAEVLARKQSSLVLDLSDLEPRLRERVITDSTPGQGSSISYTELLTLVGDAD